MSTDSSLIKLKFLSSQSSQHAICNLIILKGNSPKHHKHSKRMIHCKRVWWITAKQKRNKRSLDFYTIESSLSKQSYIHKGQWRLDAFKSYTRIMAERGCVVISGILNAIAFCSFFGGFKCSTNRWSNHSGAKPENPDRFNLSQIPDDPSTSFPPLSDPLWIPDYFSSTVR